MILAVQRWIEEAHPRLWQRRGGRDYIWLMAHDEGACYAPRIIWPGERERGGGRGEGGQPLRCAGVTWGQQGVGLAMEYPPSICVPWVSPYLCMLSHWGRQGVGLTMDLFLPPPCRHHAVPLGPTGLPSQVPHPVLCGALGAASVNAVYPASQALDPPLGRSNSSSSAYPTPGQLLQGPGEQGVAAGRLGQQQLQSPPLLRPQEGAVQSVTCCYLVNKVWQPGGWVNSSSRAQPCFDPKKVQCSLLLLCKQSVCLPIFHGAASRRRADVQNHPIIFSTRTWRDPALPSRPSMGVCPPQHPLPSSAPSASSARSALPSPLTHRTWSSRRSRAPSMSRNHPSTEQYSK